MKELPNTTSFSIVPLSIVLGSVLPDLNSLPVFQEILSPTLLFDLPTILRLIRENDLCNIQQLLRETRCTSVIELILRIPAYRTRIVLINLLLDLLFFLITVCKNPSTRYCELLMCNWLLPRLGIGAVMVFQEFLILSSLLILQALT